MPYNPAKISENVKEVMRRNAKYRRRDDAFNLLLRADYLNHHEIEALIEILMLQDANPWLSRLILQAKPTRFNKQQTLTLQTRANLATKDNYATFSFPSNVQYKPRLS